MSLGPDRKPLKQVRANLIAGWIEKQETGEVAGCFANGDATAFWSLWEQHHKYLYAVCLKQMEGIREDAEDALSLAMLKAWNKLPDYAREIANPGAWLTRLTHNLCLDLRRERRRRTRGMESLETSDDLPSGGSESPEEALLRRETRDSLLRTIDRLPKRLREPFLLRVVQEMPYPAVAAHLSISPQNARKRIQQARVLLQQKLHDASGTGKVKSSEAQCV